MNQQDPGFWSARRPMVVGIVATIVLFFGVGIWGGTTEIAGAVVASGQIQVEANRQIIQHPEGGVVGKILVDDGDKVEAGDVVMQLDGTMLQSALNVVEGQLFEILARQDRLRAERDGNASITFSEELQQLARERPEVGDLIKGQVNLFNARRESIARQTEQFRERQSQTRQQIDGTEAQLDALGKQLELIKKELTDQQTLLAKGLAQAARVLSLQREEARLLGQLGELQASIAQARGRIAEIEIEILALETGIREEAIATMRDLDFNETELRERRLTTREELNRLVIRSPMKGVIYGRQVHAIRAVVRPADPIMYVVPSDGDLVISARIEAIHIDQVHEGQEAVLRFSAFSSRDTPEITGRVVRVSADVFTDENVGVSYYLAELLPVDGEIAKLDGQELLPGMPVEAFIQTGQRSALSYFVRPLSDYFTKAFREE